MAFQHFPVPFTFLFIESIPVSIDDHLSEFTQVSFCGSCDFHKQEEKVRKTLQV